MLKFFKRLARTTAVQADRSSLEIRDLLEHPQLRAAMGLDPLPGATATATATTAATALTTAQAPATAKAPARAHRRRRVHASTSSSRPAPRPLTRSAA